MRLEKIRLEEENPPYDKILGFTFRTLWLSSHALFFPKLPLVWISFSGLNCYNLPDLFGFQNPKLPFSRTFSFLSFEIRSINANKHIKQK